MMLEHPARVFRLSLLGATSLSVLLGGSANAQSVWTGATNDYNTNANWANAVAPVMAGQAAVFDANGTMAIAVSSPVAPDSWTFNVGSQAYTITGAGVSFGGTGISNNATNAISIANDVGGTGGLLQAGTGTLTVTGTNTYTGSTQVTAGTLAAASDGGFSATSAYTVNGGTLQVNAVNAVIGSLAGTGGAVFVNQGSLIVGSDNTNTTFAGTFAAQNGGGVTSLTKVGTGTLTLTGGPGNGDNIFLTEVRAGTLVSSGGYTTPVLTVDGGATLRAGANGGIGANAVTLYDTGALDLNNFNLTVGSLSSLSTVGSTPTSSPPSTDARITLGTGTLTILGNPGLNLGGVSEHDFAGVISGAGGVTLTGGAATLSGSNTYIGPTTLSDGTLTVGSAAAAAPGSTITPLGTGVVVFDGGTLQAGGSYTIANNAAVNGTGGTIDINGATALTLSGVIANGNATTGNLHIVDTSGSTNSLVVLSGENTFSGGFTLSGYAAVAAATIGVPGAITSSALGTGTLTFDRGTLGAFNDGTVANAVAVNSAGGTIDSNGHVFTISGVIANGNGSGAVRFVDFADIPGGGETQPGTTILSGANTYTGGTTLSSGLVQVAVGTVGAPGAIVSSAVGTGTLTLDAGTLQAGGNYTVANAVALNAGGGTIDSNGHVFTLSGPIANGNAPGAVTIVDSAAAGGVVVMSGVGTYASATLVQSGTLRAGAANVFAPSSDFTVTGTLDLNGFTNTIGSLAGAGTVTLRTGTLTVGDTIDTNFSGSISGTGGLTKQGTDTLTLSGNSSYTGPTTVAAGILTVNGSISSPTQVLSGAKLNGTGTVGDVIVGNGGTLGPGTAASIGVLSATGNVTFQPGSTFAVRATSDNQNDILLASGAANLAGGTVRVQASGSRFEPDTRYLILNAAGKIASPFAGVATNLAFLTPTLSYDANNVFLDIGGPLFTAGATTPTQISVGNALQSGFAAGATGAGAMLLSDVQNLSTSQAPTALAQLSGQALTAAQETSFAAGKVFMSTVNNQAQSWLDGDFASANEVMLHDKPLAYAAATIAGKDDPFASLHFADVFRAGNVSPALRTWRAWSAGFEAAQTLKDSGGSALNLSHRTFGGAFGADYQVNPFLLAGFAVGGSDSSFAVPQSTTSGRLAGAHAGTYAAGRLGSFYATAALTYAHFDNHTTREVMAVGPIQTEHGRFGSDQAGGSFEFGYHRHIDAFTVTPFVSFAFYDTFQQSFAETGPAGALYGLNVGARDSSSVPLSFGVQVDGRLAFDNGWVFWPYLRASYQHETIRRRDLDAFLSAVPLSFFTAQGIVADSDVTDIKTGVRLWMSPNASVFANVEGQLSDRTRGYAVTGGLSILMGAAKAAAPTSDVADTPWTKTATPEFHVDAFRSSRGYPAASSLGAGGGFQVYSATTFQAAGKILPDVRLDLVAKPGFVYARQTTTGLGGSIATPTDTTAGATFTYLALNGVQPFFSLNTNLPSGTTVLKGTRANARMDPDFVSVGTYGEGLNIGPTIGVNLPFNESLTASLSVGYTHRGSYDKEGPIELATFAQGTQVFAPGSDITLSANVGYVAAPFTTQASFSYAKESITYADATPSFQAGDRFIGSITESYAWSGTVNTNFTGTVTYSAKNQVLDTNLPAFLAEAFDSNGLVARLRLDQTFAMDKWTLNPFTAFVYRDRNGYDPIVAQFVPAKSIYSGGLMVRRALSDTTSLSGSLEYFRSYEVANPAATVGGVRSTGLHAVLTGSLAF